MKDILTYIDDHITEEFTIRDLAFQSGYSPFHFIRKFKALYQCTPMEYVTRRKLIRAADEIADGCRIIDIAFRYGYHTQQAFDRAFHRYFGISPSFLKSIRLGLDQLEHKENTMNFINAAKPGTSKEELFTYLNVILRKNQCTFPEEKITALYELSKEVYKNQKRYSGEEYIIHPLNVALILAEMEAPTEVVLAGLFCDIEQKGTLPLSSLRDAIPDSIYQILCDVQQRDLPLLDLPENALMVRLAERLHNLRTLEYYPEEKRMKKIQETLSVYLPLADILQNEKLTQELNYLVEKYLP